MKKYFLFTATLFLAFFINLNTASAQDTDKIQDSGKQKTEQTAQTGSDDFQKATAVFAGEVLQVNRKENDPNATIKFAVQKTWKGKSSKEVKVSTSKDSGECVNFEVGKSYLVYTGEVNGKTVVNCSKTTLTGATAATPTKEN